MGGFYFLMFWLSKCMSPVLLLIFSILLLTLNRTFHRTFRVCNEVYTESLFAACVCLCVFMCRLYILKDFFLRRSQPIHRVQSQGLQEKSYRSRVEPQKSDNLQGFICFMYPF